MIRCVSGLQSKDGAIVHTKAEDATQHESGLRGHNGWRRKNDERKGFGRAPRISIPAIRTCQSGRTSDAELLLFVYFFVRVLGFS